MKKVFLLIVVAAIIGGVAAYNFSLQVKEQVGSVLEGFSGIKELFSDFAPDSENGSIQDQLDKAQEIVDERTNQVSEVDEASGRTVEEE